MAEDHHSLINLKILSPSTEVKGDISFPHTPASTTVQELRLRIQNEIESRPATDRMRLIYRGRVVANEMDTLTDVFGLENIRESKEQSLHLVLRELQSSSTSSSPAPRSSTAPPNPFRPVQQPPTPAQTNPFRPFPQPRPNSQPQVPHLHPHHHHPHHHHHHHHARPQHPHNPFGPMPLPPEVNNLVHQQLAQAMAQNNAPNVPVPQNQQPRDAPAPADGSQAPQAHVQPAMGMGHAPPTFPPHTTSTIRHEGIGPNGERWSITRTNANLTIPLQPNQQPILPRPFPHPPGFPLPPRQSPGPPNDPAVQTLERATAVMERIQQEMGNVALLLLEPVASRRGDDPPFRAPPVWRIDRIRQHVQNLTAGIEQVQRDLDTDTSLANSPDVLNLQQSINEIRGYADYLNTMLDRLRELAPLDQESPQGSSADQNPSSTTSSASRSPTSQTHAQPPAAHPPAAHPPAPELFILSSPQGPVGILFDQRGTYSTAPMGPTLPFQNFTQQFASNRQILAGIGQQIVQNSTRFHDQLAAAVPAQNAAPPPAGVQAPADQPAQNQNANQAPAQNAPEQDRMAIWAGNAWLALKLAFFTYLFAGHRGWYRPLIMGAIACLVYLAQLGIFENHFNRVRQHFEALLPLADRAGQAQNGQDQNAARAQREQRAEPNRNLTPEQAAQRLVQQHHNQRFGWVRQSIRTTERAFAIFVASLWPGIGERMVQAQEERQRAERAAEEERLRLEEEKRQQEAADAEAAAQQKQEAEGQHKSGQDADAPGTEGSPSKGKARAETPGQATSS